MHARACDVQPPQGARAENDPPVSRHNPTHVSALGPRDLGHVPRDGWMHARACDVQPPQGARAENDPSVSPQPDARLSTWATRLGSCATRWMDGCACLRLHVQPPQGARAENGPSASPLGPRDLGHVPRTGRPRPSSHRVVAAARRASRRRRRGAACWVPHDALAVWAMGSVAGGQGARSSQGELNTRVRPAWGEGQLQLSHERPSVTSLQGHS